MRMYDNEWGVQETFEGKSILNAIREKAFAKRSPILDKIENDVQLWEKSGQIDFMILNQGGAALFSIQRCQTLR